MKNIPEIRLKGFEGEWCYSKLENLSAFSKGQGYSKGNLNPTGNTPIILYGRMYTNYEPIITHVDTFANKKENSILSEGDEVIVPASGETAEDISIASAVVQKEVILGGDLNIIKPHKELSPSFLALSISNSKIHKELSTKAQGKSIVHLHNEDLKKVSISYPNTNEQEAISTFFQNLDNLITEQKNKLENLQKVKKSMLCKMFPKEGQKIPEIRFKGFEGNWKLITLGNVGLFHSNGVDKKIYPNEHMVNLLNYMDIYNGRIVNKKNCNSLMQVSANDRQLRDCNVLANDIFFTPSSETVEDVGHIMVIEEDLPNTCYSYHLMRFRPYKGIFYSTFPNYGFQTSFVRHQMRLMANGVQRFVLGKTEFESLQVLIPSYDEQKKIAKYFTSIETQITFQTQRLKKLKQIKSACLQKMFV